MSWLLVGIRHSEVTNPNFNYYNLDIEEADNIGHIFEVSTWNSILKKYGDGFFDVIMTDGGLMGVCRVDEIIEIKRKLLKEDGYILNYTSVIGEKIDDPLGRSNINFYKIPKKDYTIDSHDLAWDSKSINSWSDRLKCKIKLII